MARLIAALTDSGRLVRLWLDAALARARAGGTAGRERAIREQLAALWPVTLVDVTLRAPHLAAGPDHGPLDVYARDETASVAFDVVLQNNFAGIRPLRGSLRVAVDPARARAVPTRVGIALMICPRPTVVDRVRARRCVVAGKRGRDDSRVGLDAGVWRFDFRWDGRKIGERGFVISA